MNNPTIQKAAPRPRMGFLGVGWIGRNRMEAIAHPLEFKRAMQDARAHYDGYLNRGSAGVYQQPTSDLQGVLEQLTALRDNGILSHEEFEAKKRDVLSRI